MCFLFIRSCNFNWSVRVTSFFCAYWSESNRNKNLDDVITKTRRRPIISPLEWVLSFAWLKFWSHVSLSLSKKNFLNLKLTFIYFSSRDNVKWMCFTLNECYLKAAKGGSNNLSRLLIKIYHPSLQWKDYFLVFFTVYWDCRSTKLLRLFSGSLPAMFILFASSQFLPSVLCLLLISQYLLYFKDSWFDIYI